VHFFWIGVEFVMSSKSRFHMAEPNLCVIGG
ncbi:unnamed protein product, partial [marine sediment metagenome]